MKPLLGPFDPPIFELPIPNPFTGGSLAIHGFGILVALGFIIGGQIAFNRAKRTGQDPESINRLIFWLVVGTFVGGHVGYGLMYKPDEYLANPIKFLQMWEGLSSFGGFLACVPLTVWFFIREKRPIWTYMDTIAIGLTFGWFLGRMGCFAAHDHPGSPTDFFLGVYGMCPGNDPTLACHDMGLYEALWSLSMYLWFRFLDRVPRTPGIYPCLLGVVYGPVRFMMDYLRPISTDVRYGGFTPGQYWAVVFFAVSLFFLYRRLSSGDPPSWSLEPSGDAEAAGAS